ncbi:competence protein ComFC [Sinobaca qinghaiensis]|uniref:Competence protein ComFC n=1 Tax=Sinobaca qinghaiensis TaxID=342944 RepID=A0A419V8T2_9BACL|nr:phosphoribosyltransferase family protein [Sinobaca qinghaiensis]RKD76511.1 competence protein ComFC [Sinobaca qinghaiensis]
MGSKRRCLYCMEPRQEQLSWHGLISRADDPVCPDCRALFTMLMSRDCRICGREKDEQSAPFFQDTRCGDCVAWGEKDIGRALDHNISLYRYDKAMQQWMARWKYRGDPALTAVFQKEWVQIWRRSYASWKVMALPAGPGRTQERGFNQAVLLADMLPGDRLNGLEKKDEPKKQSKSTKNQRESLFYQPFYMNNQEKIRFNGEKILLVDDIYTTGTTVRKAASVLRSAGAERVASFTLARSTGTLSRKEEKAQ